MTRLLASLLLAAPLLVHAAGAPFQLASPDFKAGGTLKSAQVFNSFGCNGANQSPALAWKNAPAGTRSFGLTVNDPDAPTGSGWWHWTVFNIPATAAGLPADAGGGRGLPAGAVEGRTDFGKPGYGGPCPPAGDPPHHYVFTLYALKTDKIDADANASGAMVGFMLNANALAKATLTGRYSR